MYNKKIQRYVLIFLVGFLLLASLSQSVSVFRAEPVEAAKKDEGEAWAFYQINSAAANYLSERMSPSKDGTPKTIEFLTGLGPGEAGAFLGFPDAKGLKEKLQTWLTSLVSQASLTYSYDSLIGLRTSSGVSNELYVYGRYGYLLSEIGFDQAAALGSGVGRKIVGWIINGVYQFADSARFAIYTIIQILKNINPFQLLSVERTITLEDIDGGSFTRSNDYMISAFNGAIKLDCPDDPMCGVATLYSDIYQTIATIAWYLVIPLFLVFIILAFTLFQSQDKWNKVRRFLTYMAFIVIGVPLIGNMYTSILDKTEGELRDDNSPITMIIASTFVDFGSWVNDNSLGVYDGMILQSQSSYSSSSDMSLVKRPAGKPSALTIASLRKNALIVNAKSGSVGIDQNSEAWERFVNQGGDFETEFINAFGFNNDIRFSQDSIHKQINRLMSAFNEGEFYDPADFETTTKHTLMSQHYGAHEKDIAEMFSLSSEYDNWKKAKETLYPYVRGTGERGAYSIFKGSLAYDTIQEDAYPGPADRQGLGDIVFYGGASGKGLSDMAMYNYLNTKFTTRSMRVYSPSDTTSNFTRETHYTVNLVGTGLISFAMVTNTIVTLVVFGFLGWGYAVAMLFDNIKRTFEFLLGLPFAVLGAVRYIAQVILLVGMMILEIVITATLYALIMDFLGAIPFVVGDVAYDVLTSPRIGMKTNEGLVILGLFLASAVLIYFLITAFKIRKSVIKGLDEAMSQFINKFVGGGDGMSGTPQSKPSALGRGLAAGAGAAIAHNLTRPRRVRGKSNEEKAKGQESDADEAKEVKPDDGQQAKGLPAPGGGGSPGGGKQSSSSSSGGKPSEGKSGRKGGSSWGDGKEEVIIDSKATKKDSPAQDDDQEPSSDFGGDGRGEEERQREAEDMLKQDNLDDVSEARRIEADNEAKADTIYETSQQADQAEDRASQIERELEEARAEQASGEQQVQRRVLEPQSRPMPSSAPRPTPSSAPRPQPSGGSPRSQSSAKPSSSGGRQASPVRRQSSQVRASAREKTLATEQTVTRVVSRPVQASKPQAVAPQYRTSGVRKVAAATVAGTLSASSNQYARAAGGSISQIATGNARAGSGYTRQGPSRKAKGGGSAPAPQMETEITQVRRVDVGRDASFDYEAQQVTEDFRLAEAERREAVAMDELNNLRASGEQGFDDSDYIDSEVIDVEPSSMDFEGIEPDNISGDWPQDE